MANVASRVGIRELKAHLSQVVQRASAGQRFAVTDHGRVVAELGPVAADDGQRDDVSARVVASGGIAATRSFDLLCPSRAPDWQPVDVLGLLDELRGER
jgi:prevent-host-death family protein